MLDILAGVRRGDIVGIQETERLHKSGHIIPVAVTISPIKDAHGKVIGASSIARDITKQKQAEFERQQLVKTVLPGPPRGDLKNAGHATDPKPWWKLW